MVELDGAVTATRSGAARPLTVGARIHDDDVISTGAGRVAIQLDRNQVVWRLGPNLSQTVAQSAAWTAPKADTQVATTGEHSAAAGRHAEREAADTAISAAPAAPPPAATELAATEPVATARSATPRSAPSRGAPTAAPDEGAGAAVPDPPDVAVSGDSVTAPPPPALAGALSTDNGGGAAPTGLGLSGPGGGGGGGSADGLGLAAPAEARRQDDQAGDLDQEKGSPTTPSRSPKIATPSPTVVALGAVTARGLLDREAVTVGLDAGRVRLAACFRTGGARFGVSATIGADGKATAISVRGAGDQATCVKAAIAATTFATAAGATRITAAFTVR